MNQMQNLLRLADLCVQLKHAPPEFIRMMGLRNASMEYCDNAWALFKLWRRPLTHQEIKEYMKRKKEAKR